MNDSVIIASLVLFLLKKTLPVFMPVDVSREDSSLTLNKLRNNDPTKLRRLSMERTLYFESI